MSEDLKKNIKAPKFSVDDRVEITKYKNIFSKTYTKYWSRKIFVNGYVLNINPWTHRIKYVNGEKTGSFYKKGLLLSKL